MRPVCGSLACVCSHLAGFGQTETMSSAINNCGGSIMQRSSRTGFLAGMQALLGVLLLAGCATDMQEYEMS